MDFKGILVAAGVMTLAASASADPIFGSNDPAAGRDQGGHVTPAQRAPAGKFRPGFGARIGGYGFRDPHGGVMWDACRMNGFGVFGTLDWNKYLYGKLALDLYSATPATVKRGLDRTSTEALLGAGFRMLPDFVITPYVELGGGGEYTHVSLPTGVLSGVYPMGYVGLGGEINVTRQLKLGATVRMLATTRPTFASAQSGSIYGSSAESALTGQAADKPQMQYDIASEAQFHVRYAL